MAVQLPAFTNPLCQLPDPGRMLLCTTFEEFAFKLAVEIQVSFSYFNYCLCCAPRQLYILLEYLGTIEVSCDFGNKFRSDIAAAISGSK